MPQIGLLTFNPDNGDVRDAQGNPVTVLDWSNLGQQNDGRIPELLVAMVETLEKNQSVTEIHGDASDGLGGFEPHHLASVIAVCQHLKVFKWDFNSGGEDEEVQVYEAFCRALAEHDSIQEVLIDVAFDYDKSSDRLDTDRLVGMLRNPNITRLDVGRKRLNEDEFMALIQVINGPDSGLEVFQSSSFPAYEYFSESGPHVDTDLIPYLGDPGVMGTDQMVPDLLALCRNPRVRQFDLTLPRAWSEKSSQAVDAELRRRMCTRPLALSQGGCDFVLQQSATLLDKEMFEVGAELSELISKAVSMGEDSAAAKKAMLDMAKENDVMGRLNKDYVRALALDCGKEARLAACMKYTTRILTHDQAALAFYKYMHEILEKTFIALTNKSRYLEALVFASAMDVSKVGALPVVGALVSHVPALSSDEYEFSAWIDSTNWAIEGGDRKLFDRLLALMCEIAQAQLRLGIHSDKALKIFSGSIIAKADLIEQLELRVHSVGGALKRGPMMKYQVNTLAVDAFWTSVCMARASGSLERERSDGAGAADAVGSAVAAVASVASGARLFSRPAPESEPRPVKRGRFDGVGPAGAAGPADAAG